MEDFLGRVRAKTGRIGSLGRGIEIESHNLKNNRVWIERWLWGIPLWENETGVSLSCLYGEDAIQPSRGLRQTSYLARSLAVVWCYRVDSFWLSQHLIYVS